MGRAAGSGRLHAGGRCGVSAVRLESGGDGLVRLTIDRPPLNVLDLATLGELRRRLESVERGEVEATDGPAPRVLIVAAAGERAFSAGVAVQDHTREQIAPMLETFHAALAVLRRLPAVSIAAVRGLCLGGGLELAAACDLVVAADGATFGQPEIELACFPPYAAALYPRWLGPQRAADLLLTGRRLSAAEAEAWGLVARRAADADLDAAVDELAAALLAKSGAALALTRRALAAGAAAPFAEALTATERLYLDDLAATADMDEGVAAFLAKRPPRWRHR